MKYIVVCTEHTDCFCDDTTLCKVFNSKDKAIDYIHHRVELSLSTFKDEFRESWNSVRSYDASGDKIDYGCVWNIIEIDENQSDDDDALDNYKDSEVEDKDVKYPNHYYQIYLADGRKLNVDVGNEDDWGNIQPCATGDCEDWIDSIGWGNDNDGHTKIVRVVDSEDNSMWFGNKAVGKWYDERVSTYLDKYLD
jgi:hypothetical protein